MAREASARFPPDPRSAGRSRQFVKRTLAGWRLQHLDEPTVLLTSEMVANAVLHTRSAVTVRMRRRGGGVVVDVGDESPVTPRLRSFSTQATTGRGLRLLDGIAAEWGVESVPPGKRVWFRVEAGNGVPEAEVFDMEAVEAL